MQDRSINSICDKAIIACAKGEQNALSAVYDAMARMIFSVAFAITGHYEDAEDVLQETMLAIVRYAPSYRKGSNARAWIMTMVRHISIDTVRRKKAVIDIEQADITQIPDSRNEYSQLEVLSLLRILDEDEKQLVLFRLYARLPYADIAGMMGIGVSAAQKKYQRALKKLKSQNDWL